MRNEASLLVMGLFLHAVGSTPTATTADTNLKQCEGVNNQSYICESGHCCGESQCCSYYYELWWFWLVWAIIFILSCCCVCHHRRTKHRLQQQQRQHEINLIAYREAHNYPSLPFYFRFLPNYLLPDYEEVVNRPPTPPPPYSALHSGPTTVVTGPLAPEQSERPCTVIQPTAVPPSADVCLYGRHSPVDSQPPPGDFISANKPLHATQDAAVILSSEGLNSEGLANHQKECDGPEDPGKDALLGNLSDGSADDKERQHSGRMRRFTGDSGIEVCVCGSQGSSGCSSATSSGQEGRPSREVDTLLGREDEKGDFCDSCGHRSSYCVEEEPRTGCPERRAAHGPSQASHRSSTPVCLLLHTISEQEAPQHGTSTEPQG
ncbi:WW domain binding protein 1-like b [Synchiropus picturatus]